MVQIPLLPVPLEPVPLQPGKGFVESPPAPPIDLPQLEPPGGTEPAPEPEPVYPVPPAEPKQPGTLPDLLVLAAIIVILGLALIADAFTNWIRWALSQFMPPRLRKRIPSVSTQKLVQGLTNRLGEAEQGFDAELGGNFHKMAGLVAHVGAALVAVAQAENQLARRLAGLETGRAQTQHAIHHATAAAATAQETARHARQRAQAEGERARKAEQTFEHRLKQLEHYKARVLEPELDGLRHRIPELQRGQHRLNEIQGKHSEALSITGLVAGTAMALDKLGGGWIRCEANQLLGRGNCARGPDLWRRLLADALPALAVADLCLVADGVMKTTHAVQPLMLRFVDVEEALIGCHGATKAKPIKLAGYSATPVLAPVAL